MNVDILLAVLGAVAGAIAAIAGFGIGSLLTPAVGTVIGIKAAVAVVAIPHALATAVRLWTLRRAVDRPTLLHFGLASAMGGLAGAVLHAAFSSPVLAAFLGILLIVAGALELTAAARRVRISGRWVIAAGVASGAFGGLVGNQGGIRSAALLRFDLAPQALVATATATALLVDAVRLPVYLISSGTSVAANAQLVVQLSVAVLIGTIVGAPILRRLPEPAFRRLLAAFLICLGVALLAGLGT
jgi:uncharacterized membrane protein YfcA